MPEPEKLPLIECAIVEPTAKQMEAGLANLTGYLPYWQMTPALLVIKPALGLIVSVLGCTHDRMGFQLRLAVEEQLEAPPEYNDRQVDVGCVWNQPYMWFDKTQISAPYSFYLHFGSEGVARAREVNQSMRPDMSGRRGDLILGVLRACFSR